MTLQDLIEELGGNLVQGDPEWMVDGVNSCEKASAFDLAFADSDAAVAAALESNAGVVVLKPGAARSIRTASASSNRISRSSGLPRRRSW